MKRFYLLLGGLAFIVPAKAFAQLRVQANILDEFDKAGAAVFGSANTAPTLVELIGNGIQIALSLLGVVLLFYILYAGFLWMTAGGTQEKVQQAQGIIRNCIIGIIIILASYSITLFVERALQSSGLAESDAPATTTPQTP